MPKILHSAFTCEYNTRVREIVTPVSVSRAGLSNNEGSITCASLWDTGATSSVISENIVSTLNLKSHDKVRTMTANGWALRNVYYVNIFLPNDVMIPSVRVTNIDFNDDPDNTIDVLIGMDIISLGDFAITHANGLTTVSFIMPPHEKIDFVPIANTINSQTNR